MVFYPNKHSESTFWMFKDMFVKTVKAGGNTVRERISEKYEKLMRYD